MARKVPVTKAWRRSGARAARMTDSERREQAAGNFSELSSRVDAEMAVGWAIKTSIESRALGLFALNLGVVTLYLALSEGLRLDSPDVTSFFYWVLWASFVGAAVSLGLALVAAWPARYDAMSVKLLTDSYTHSKDADTVLLPDLIPQRLQALQRLRDVNTTKSGWVVASMTAAAVSVLGFAITVLGAVLCC